MDYVKDGTLTIQARTIKEVNSIDRVVVYADGCEREFLMPLPAIEEREEGEWLDAGMDGEKCSRCGWSIDDTFYSSQFLYCPNCGARVKGE